MLHGARGPFSRTLTRNADGGFTVSNEKQTLQLYPTTDGRSQKVAGENVDRPTAGKLKWSLPLGSIVGFTSAAIAEDRTIYIGGKGSRLYAVNPDGTQKWTFAAGGYVIAAPTIAQDGTIDMGTYGKRIHAIAPDGTEKWSYPVGGTVLASSPALDKDGMIYVGSRDGNLYAIDGESGKLADSPWPMFGRNLRHTGR